MDGVFIDKGAAGFGAHGLFYVAAQAGIAEGFGGFSDEARWRMPISELVAASCVKDGSWEASLAKSLMRFQLDQSRSRSRFCSQLLAFCCQNAVWSVVGGTSWLKLMCNRLLSSFSSFSCCSVSSL